MEDVKQDRPHRLFPTASVQKPLLKGDGDSGFHEGSYGSLHRTEGAANSKGSGARRRHCCGLSLPRMDRGPLVYGSVCTSLALYNYVRALVGGRQDTESWLTLFPACLLASIAAFCAVARSEERDHTHYWSTRGCMLASVCAGMGHTSKALRLRQRLVAVMALLNVVLHMKAGAGMSISDASAIGAAATSFLVTGLLFLNFLMFRHLPVTAGDYTPETQSLVRNSLMAVIVILIGGFVFNLAEGGTFSSEVYKAKASWDFGYACRFSMATLTTIGYGDLYPTTMQGRICLFVYFPIGATFIAILGDRMKTVAGLRIKRLASKSRVRNLRTKSKHDAVSLTQQDRPASSVGEVWNAFRQENGLAVLWYALIAMLGGTFVFTLLEPDWDVFQSAYFCFVTLCTIGYGDLGMSPV